MDNHTGRLHTVGITGKQGRQAGLDICDGDTITNVHSDRLSVAPSSLLSTANDNKNPNTETEADV